MRLTDADVYIEHFKGWIKQILLDDFNDIFNQGSIEGIESCIAMLEDAPTIEAEPVKHGRWIDRYGGKYANAIYDCSECKEKACYKPERTLLGSVHFVQDLSAFCPHCGAKMDMEV